MWFTSQIHSFQKAWAMRQEDHRQQKAMALLEYVESKQEVAMLWEKITEIGDFFENHGRRFED